MNPTQDSTVHLHNPDDFSRNQSAPDHHSRTTGQKIAWDRTTILTTTRYKTQLDLTEHTAIKTKNPSLNRADSAPTCSKLWDPIIPKIACTIKPRPAGISFPKKKWFYYFSIFYYFRFLLLRNRQPHLNSLTPLPLIIFMTGTDTTQPFILSYTIAHSTFNLGWRRLPHAYWKLPIFYYITPNILLYYYVSINSLLSTILQSYRIFQRLKVDITYNTLSILSKPENH